MSQAEGNVGLTNPEWSEDQSVLVSVRRLLEEVDLSNAREARAKLVQAISALTASVLPNLKTRVKEENFLTNNVAKSTPAQ
jgi:hypothetical protein